MQVVAEVPEQAITLPVDLEQYEDERADIEGRIASGELSESVVPMPISLMTTDDAARAMKRIAYHQEVAASIARPFDEEIARLKAEISRLEFEKESAMKPWLNRANWYRGPLEAFMRAMAKANAKIKTWPTPWGELKLRAQQPEWKYGDESTITTVLSMYRPELVRVKEEPDKNALKKAAMIQDGKVYITDETGELHELPIEVVEREPKFDIDLKGA